MKRVWRVLFSHTFLFIVLALVQIAVSLLLTEYLSKYTKFGPYLYVILTILAALIVVVVLGKDDLNPAYKIMWLLIVVAMPVSGTVFYLMMGSRVTPKKARILSAIEQRAAASMAPDPAVAQRLEAAEPTLRRSVDYLASWAAAPVYDATETEYYPLGEDFFPRFLEEIGKAEKYIFLEYFIIDDESEMWRRTLEILEAKAAAGVDVRVLYDGFGCIATLPPGYDGFLRGKGIRCTVFNSGHLSAHISDYKILNHRDHRKITVVDGEVGFNGGLNFADEYINVKHRFGVWKDTGFLLRGPAVYSLTVMFLKMWDFANATETDFTSYRPGTPRPAAQGYVQPYSDSPLDEENVAENAYFNVLQRAEHYVYIVTPYLIIDHEMLSALCLTAKSGVDVRILVPGIPDKWYAYAVTRSYYAVLLRAGVRIYEFTPGFIHAKMYASDDKVAIVGSANMDYRSLYLHFENCCSFYGGPLVADVKRDIDETLGESREILLADVEKTALWRRLLRVFFRFFAPMM